MEQPPRPAYAPRNPHTEASHRRDVRLQIQLPLVLAIVAALTAIAFVVLSAGVGGRSTWADVSLIFLIVVAALMALAPLAVIVGLIYGLTYAFRYLPGYAKVAQDFLRLVSYHAREYSERVTDPVVKARGVEAWVRSVIGGRDRAAVQTDKQARGSRMSRMNE